LNYWDAHDPYVPPPGFRRHEPANRDEAFLLRNWWWIRKDEISGDQVAVLRGAYEDCIRGLDRRIGQMLDRLRREGELDNTLLIVTADHGEHFAEHGLFLHGNSLYEPLLHVPLIVVWPGEIPAGVRVETPVSLSGLPNTIMELVGGDATFPGESWVRHWNEAGPAAPPAGIAAAEIGSQAAHPACHGRSPVAHGPMRCVRDGDLKYISGGDGLEEVYDLARDPLEQNNLVEQPDYATAVERLRHISAEMGASGQAR
jgi:arylsulfatase A-like enzyme